MKTTDGKADEGKVTVSQAVTKALRAQAEKLLPILTKAEGEQQELAKKQGSLIWPFLLDVAQRAVKSAADIAGEGKPVDMSVAKAYFVAYMKELEFAMRLKFCKGDKEQAAQASMSEIYGAWGNYKSKAAFAFESYPKGKDNEPGEALNATEYKGAAAAAEFQRDAEKLYANRPKSPRQGGSGQGKRQYTEQVRAQLDVMGRMLDGLTPENLDNRVVPLLVRVNGELAAIMASQKAANVAPISDAQKPAGEVDAPARNAA